MSLLYEPSSEPSTLLLVGQIMVLREGESMARWLVCRLNPAHRDAGAGGFVSAVRTPNREYRIPNNEYRIPNTESQIPKPKTRNQRPEARDPKRKTRNPNPEFRHPKLESPPTAILALGVRLRRTNS